MGGDWWWNGYQDSWTWPSRSWQPLQSWDHGLSDDGYRLPKDDDPPEWDGKSMPMLKYFRLIDLWQASLSANLSKHGSGVA